MPKFILIFRSILLLYHFYIDVKGGIFVLETFALGNYNVNWWGLWGGAGVGVVVVWVWVGEYCTFILFSCMAFWGPALGTRLRVLPSTKLPLSIWLPTFLPQLFRLVLANSVTKELFLRDKTLIQKITLSI